MGIEPMSPTKLAGVIWSPFHNFRPSVPVGLYWLTLTGGRGLEPLLFIAYHPKERYVGVEPTKTCLEGRNLNRSACNAKCQHYSTPTELPDGLSPPSLHMAVDAFTRVKGSGVGELTTALFSAIVYSDWSGLS